MQRGNRKALGELLKSALVAVSMAAALAGSHAMVGQLSLARASGESSGTPVEDLRHETLALRRESQLTVHVTWRSPTFELPLVFGRVEAMQALDRFFDLSPVSGGQHSLRNGIGAPLLT